MRLPSEFNPGDVLNEALQSVRLRSAVYCRAKMTSRWGFRVEKRDHARFHYITSGQCWIEIDGTGDPLQVHEGDLVILTGGQAHSLRDQLDSPVERLSELLVRLPLDKKKSFVWENGGECTTMLCGGFRLEERKANPLLTSLPPVLLIRGHANSGVSVRPAFQLVEDEMAESGPGSEALVSRISDVIFLQAVRASFAADCDRAPGLVRGLSDPAVAKAMSAVHSRLDHAWTVEMMAREAGMSRSAFSSRFAELVGEPPMSYLSRWRLNRAAFWLRSSDLKLAEVAARVGYESEASLGRTFKKCFGLSPGAYRRHSIVSNSDGSAMRSPIEKIPLYPSELLNVLSGLCTAAKATKA
jgi:AraC-like DNA-binding protein